MDFGGIEKSGHSTSSPFNVAFTSESRCCQDRQHRHRKSPLKRLRVTRTSALAIDQLKSGFQSDFTPRARIPRNWRPEFLIRYLGDNQRGGQECTAVQRGKSRSFVPEAPRICSIALRFGGKNLGDIDDPSNSCGAMRNFKRRFRRSMIIYKYWVAASLAKSLEKCVNRQTSVTDYPKSADDCRLDEKSDCHDDQSHELIKEEDRDVRNTSQSGEILEDRFVTSGLDHPPLEVDRKYDGSRVAKKDAQVQTSSKRNSRRRRARKNWWRATNEKILRCERIEPTYRSSIADFRSDLFTSNRASLIQESRLSIRFLENKRAEYFNKFTAVKRQIEEITATLGETCHSEKSSRSDPENCECRESKLDATLDEVGDREDNRVISMEKRNAPERGDELIGEAIDNHRSDEVVKTSNRKNERAPCVNKIDNKTPIFSSKKYPENTDVATTDLLENPDTSDVFVRDCIQTFAIKKTTKRHFVQRKLLDEDRSSDEDRLTDDFAMGNGDENFAEVSVEGLPRLEEPRYHEVMVGEKEMGEIAILNGIKHRIDQDFDDPSTRSENDTEDLSVLSRKSVNFESDSQLYQSATMEDTASTIVESSPSLSSRETQIRDSMWTDGTSELSNRNSTFSMYHSCTQFPSFVSLREDEPLEAAEDGDSYSNFHADSYDLTNPPNTDDPASSSDSSRPTSNIDRPPDDVRIFPRDASANKYTSPGKFLYKPGDESSDTYDVFKRRGVATKIYDCGYLLGESNEEEKASCVHLDSTFETSKSSRYIGSIDSGVFVNSSLIDLQAHESSLDAGRAKGRRRQRRATERGLYRLERGSSRTYDFSSDSGTDDTLDRRINNVIRDLTKNLVLCERRVRMKLKEMRQAGLKREIRYIRHGPPRACKLNDGPRDAYYGLFESPRGRPNEDERISGVSTPSFTSLPESDVEDSEPSC